MKKISLITTFFLLLLAEPCIYFIMHQNKVPAIKPLHFEKQLKSDKFVEMENLILPVAALAKKTFY
ncbi:MAG: hypothetical protein JWN76_245 [Chitinophagaceae bacterium]|nr:hypothetical protein [Chitinophagaceae bacterium]